MAPPPPPTLKRRRPTDRDGIHKPFKSPFRTPLKQSPSSVDSPGSVSLSPAPSTAFQKPPGASRVASRRPLAHTPNRVVPSSPASHLASQIAQVKQTISTLQQATSIITMDKDAKLEELIEKWRSASRAAAEELYSSSRDRVDNMGGMRAWRQKERERMEWQNSWDGEDPRPNIDADGEENEAVNSGMRQKYDDESDAGERKERQNGDGHLDGSDDDSFTMDMMLKTLHVDLDVIGYSKKLQRWVD